MIRVLVFFAAIAAFALLATWFADHPGDLTLHFGGQAYETSLSVALLILLALMVAMAVAWKCLSFFLALPHFVSFRLQMRRRRKGMSALSRGMVAIGAGDVRAAQRHSADALKHLGKEPLTQLLKAQTAQLSGDRNTAEATFAEMTEHAETRLLGLRGLHVEARRKGDSEAAHAHAVEAHRVAGLPWAGQAVLEHRTATGDWIGALEAVERNAVNGHIDKAVANRQRAVLKTAIALEKADQSPEEALHLAREANRLAPDLIPASVLAGRLLARQGDLRRAIKVYEAAWRLAPHPDVAEGYLHVRHGDSASDRLARARALARLAPRDPESRLTVARAALDAREFEVARESLAPLVENTDTRPTVRACLAIADIEEVANGGAGKVREWLARAARAPRDPAWIADGVASDRWAPISPVTGRLDAFVWRAPTEQLEGPSEGMLAMNGRPQEPPPLVPPLLSRPAVPEVEASPIKEIAPPAGETARPESPEVQDKCSLPRPSRATFPSNNQPIIVQPPQPVVFPAPAAPDDPGPEPREKDVDGQFGFLT
jgi:HemY protein